MNNNLPPGVSVSDLPGNRPIDEAWDRYYAEFDTKKERDCLTEALMDQFKWQLTDTASECKDAAILVGRLVASLDSAAFIALDRGMYGGKPSFEEWLESHYGEPGDDDESWRYRG